MTKIGFYEIDGGPSGIYWAGMIDNQGPYIGTWHTVEGMLKTARMLKTIGHDIRFYTQAEYELNLSLED